MTVDEYVAQIVPYFLDEEYDVLTPLPQAKYYYLLQLIDRATDEHPGDSAFWFWRAWALQFYSGPHALYLQHPNFKLIKDAYTRVLELQPNHSEAYFMLAYLYWDSAKRALNRNVHLAPGTSEAEQVQVIGGFGEARRQWGLFVDEAGLSMIMEVWWTFYPFQARTWSELLRQMLPDVVDREDQLVVYLSWGFHWMDCDYGAKDKRKYKYAFQQARWAFSQGADLSASERTYDMKLDCLYLLARLHSSKYGGDPVEGLAMWLKYAEYAAECGRKYQPNKSAEPCYIGRNTTYAEDDIISFWNANPSLQKTGGVADILLSLAALGVVDLCSSGSGKLNWYIGSHYMSKQTWDKAESYLSSAHREMGSERELIVQLATVLYKQGKDRESITLLRSLPGNAPQDELIRWLAVLSATTRSDEELLAQMRQISDKTNAMYGLLGNLGESLATALDNFRMPLAPSRLLDSQDPDELAASIANRVSKKIAEMVVGQTTLVADVQRKCQDDLHGTWHLLSSTVQEQIVNGEMLHLLLPRSSIQDYSPLIVQWGKVAELLLCTAVIEPFGSYLDKTRYCSAVEIKRPKMTGGFKQDEIKCPSSNPNWAQRLGTLNFSSGVNILYGAQQADGDHVFCSFLDDLHVAHGQAVAWLSLVPAQLDVIRERRNDAAHDGALRIRSDALTVRSTLFAGGLLRQMALLLEHRVR